MMNARVIAAGACVSCAGRCLAGVAVHSVAFGSPTGLNHITLSPGQSTMVYVNIWWGPGPTPGGPIGLSDGAFSLSGSGNGSGTWSNFNLPSPWGLQQCGCSGWWNPPTVSGNSVNNVMWGFGFLFTNQHPAPDDPANVWQAKFTAGSPGEINFLFTNMPPTGVFVAASQIPTVVSYASTGFGAHIEIVPAPAPLAVMGAGAMLTARRRRQ